ncbi:MAG: M20 family metallopeptidase [bacterium]
MDVIQLVAPHKQYVIDMRREFHQHPEPSWKETETSRRIKRELDSMGIPYRPAGDPGLVATIEGAHPGKTVALRADMDALEVTEANEVDYKSQNPGISHACGHDAHMAMLLGAARVLNGIKAEIRGTVKLIFQPAEELVSGAESIIRDGGLDGVDTIFGIHIIGFLPIGLICAQAGARLSSADHFEIRIKGQGGHGGLPHQGVDAIVAASAVVMNLQSIVSRECDPTEPVVVSIGMFHAGTRNNVIADSARLEGTVRLFNKELGQQMPGIIERIARSTAQAYRAEAELTYTVGVPPTVNDPGCAQRAAASIQKIAGEGALFEVPPVTGAEDFAFYTEKVPGVFVFLGAGNEAKGGLYPQHHEKFNIDEDALETGTALHVQYALDFLNE